MRAPRWLLPVVLGTVALIVIGDAMLMRRHPLAVARHLVPDKIGLAAARDGDALTLQWNRNAGVVRSASHALLYVEDGKHQSQFNLTAAQLVDSTVRYWPETQNVRFRLAVYHGSENVADEVRIAAERSVPVVHTASRTVVERARPSPFEQARPEVVRRQLMPTAVSSAAASRDPDPPVSRASLSEEPRQKGFLSRIPLLRRLRKHPQTTDPLPVDDSPTHR